MCQRIAPVAASRRLRRIAELPWISADGPFGTLLLERCNGLGLTSWITESFTRGLWRQATDAADGPGAAVSGRCGGDCAARKALAESGRLEHVAMRPGDDIRRWIEEFARRGKRLKGARGSALACSEAASAISRRSRRGVPQRALADARLDYGR